MQNTSRQAKISLIVAITLLNLGLAVGVHLAFGSGTSADAALKPVAPKPQVVSEEERIIALVAKTSPAVVSILAEQKATNSTYNVGSDGTITPDSSATGTYEESGRGTGFLVSADGMIVTNRHVVDDRSGKYTVFLADDRQFDASILDIDPVNDLALIRIDATGLPYLQVAPTDTERVGEDVVAIGNALGKYSNTVTRGILSGVNRSLEADDPRNGAVEQLDDMLQTDAAINSGNSGGPLLNSAGLVIGVNTAVETSGSDLGFAIPASEVRSDLSSYARYGSISHPRLGVRYVMVTPEVVKEDKLTVKYGALVTADPDLPAVVPNGPADKAGVKPNDIILEVDGKKLEGQWTLAKAIGARNIGDWVKLKVLHGDVTLNLSALLDAHLPYGY
jgi:serine protease Do